MKTDSPPGRWQFMTYPPGWWKRAGTRRNGATVVAIAAGLSMGASLLAKGIFHVNWKACRAASCWRISVIPLVYYRHNGPPAIIYRKHRNCGTPVMQKPTMSNVGLLMRLWGMCCWVIFSGQVLLRGHLNICHLQWRNSRCICQNRHGCDEETPSEMFANAIISGWLIATMVGCFLQRVRQRLWWLYWWPGYCPGWHHPHRCRFCWNPLSGFNGTLHWSDFIWPFALPTLAGTSAAAPLSSR